MRTQVQIRWISVGAEAGFWVMNKNIYKENKISIINFFNKWNINNFNIYIFEIEKFQ